MIKMVELKLIITLVAWLSYPATSLRIIRYEPRKRYLLVLSL